MNSPVLFVVFNRPDTTKKVFEAIRAAEPATLYIAADGPRSDRSGEAERCREVRHIVSAIDWKCELKTLFRSSNSGCRLGVSGAVNWFFEHEEAGIILEDDVLPQKNFFRYCDLMLQHYCDDERIMMICGFNPDGAGVVSDRYFFSENPSVWGWATWKSRWKLYDIDMPKWPDPLFSEYLRHKFPAHVSRYYTKAFNKTKAGIISSWDYQWNYTILSNYGLVLKPAANMIMNIGTDGTHTSNRDHNHFVPYGTMNPDRLTGPATVVPDVACDNNFYATRIRGKRLFRLKQLLGIHS